MKLDITWVSGYFGWRVVSSLEAGSAISQIVGLDVAPPVFSSVKLPFVRMDVRVDTSGGFLMAN